MITPEIEISDRTQVTFLIGNRRIIVAIREEKLRIESDGAIMIQPVASNNVKIKPVTWE